MIRDITISSLDFDYNNIVKYFLKSILTFKNILSDCDWEALFPENHPNIAYNEFLKDIL